MSKIPMDFPLSLVMRNDKKIKPFEGQSSLLHSTIQNTHITHINKTKIINR